MKPAVIAVLAVALLVGVGFFAAGCGVKSYKGQAPTANQPVNTFEEYAYAVLLDAQTGLAEVDKKLKSGELPKSVTADYDRAAVIYNTAIAALKRYDAVMRSGGDPSTIQTEISSELADLVKLGLQLTGKTFGQK